MSRKRSLHVMVDTEIYEKLRHVCFYERITLAEILRRLLTEFLEEKADEEAEAYIPHQL
ncbi:MAG: hypothetical protein ACM3X6_09710 [Patescibacteria group bacterium]